MRFIDTHSHIYDDTILPEIETILKNAANTGVEKILMPGIDSSCINNMMELEAKYPQQCIAMMGLHPCYVKEYYEQELTIVEQWLSKRKFVAIGEIGLDFYWDKTFTEQQHKAFEIQMQWAIDFNTPIVIHTRNAMGETIEAVKPFVKKGLRGAFHCFSGSYESAKQIIDMGFYLGLGGVLTYKNAGVTEAIKEIPMEYLILETDAPYLPPVPYRGKRNEPAFMIEVAKKLAEVKQLPLLEIAAITTANAERLFGL
jgi:TatD DNase family protein